MTGMLFISAAISVLLGLGLVAVMILERRRSVIRERIVESIGIAAGPRIPSQSMLRLDAGPRDAPARLRWLPAPLMKSVRAAFDGTGNRITLFHVFVAAAVGALVSVLIAARLLSLSPVLVVIVALGAALLAPAALIKHAQARFQFAFLNIFPNALDLIVRAVRAGLPVSEAIATVSTEVDEPVGGEFRRVAEAMKIGVELDQELLRTAERIRIIEFRFFVAALGLQRQTGGNLAETLENLSMTIRRRKDVRLKARAVMSESRASAWLIGVLPFVGGGAAYFMTPNYIQMLFTDPRGNSILGAAIVSLALGAFTMRTMIKRVMR